MEDICFWTQCFCFPNDEGLITGQPFVLGLKVNWCSCFHYYTEMRYSQHYTFVLLCLTFYYSSKKTLQLLIMYLWLNFRLLFLEPRNIHPKVNFNKQSPKYQPFLLGAKQTSDKSFSTSRFCRTGLSLALEGVSHCLNRKSPAAVLPIAIYDAQK